MKGKELRRRIRASATRGLPGLMRILPEAVGREICVWIGWGGHLLVGRDRRLARANLSRVYPQWDTPKVKRFARIVFEEIGRNAYDFLRYPSLSGPQRDALVRFEGQANLDAAIARGKGVVVVTAHLGCWEILAAGLARQGYSLKALARPLREPRLDSVLRKHRADMGVRTISSQTMPIAAIRHLKGGGVLGVLADQRVKEGGEVVEFLDQPTRMTDSPARFAQASGAAIVPVGIRRLEDNRHVITALPALEIRGVSSFEVTQMVANSLAQLIRETPEQWIWIHPRWEDAPANGKTNSPTGEPAPGKKETVCV